MESEKIVMPKIPKQEDITLKDKLNINCAMVAEKTPDHCIYTDCCNCGLDSISNFNKCKPKSNNNELIKWPISSKERFFVLPRVFVNAMSNKWQKRFLSLMNEYNKESPTEKEPVKFRVSATRRGKYIKMPDIFK